MGCKWEKARVWYFFKVDVNRFWDSSEASVGETYIVGRRRGVYMDRDSLIGVFSKPPPLPPSQ